MPRPPEYEGSSFRIECLVRPDRSCPAGDFIDGLESSDRKKFDVLFEMMGEHGHIRNKEKFKKVEGSDGIFEFKSYQLRLLCFFAPGRRVILLDGVRKKRDKLNRADVARAELYKREFQ